MQKFTCLFLSIVAVIFMFTSANAQTAIVANSVSGSASIKANVAIGAWEDVATCSVTLTAGEEVIVIATIETSPDAKKDPITQYRITDGGTSSLEIQRYADGSTFDDHGMLTVSHVFTYTPAETGPKDFILQHSKGGTDKQKNFTSEATMVAMVVKDGNVNLPVSNKATADITTTSTTYVEITGTKTDLISLSKPGSIYLTTSFTTFGDAALTGSWILRYSADGTNFFEIPNSEISRTNSTDPGAATITYLMENQPAGDYYFDVAHKTNNGTLTTRNLSFTALGLVDNTNGNVFQAFKNAGQSNTNSTATFAPAASNVVTSLNATNSLFMHSTFNMSSPNIVEPAAFTLTFTGGGTFTPFTLERYIPAGGTGSGGIVGLAADLAQGTDYTVALEHQSIADSVLTTENINLVGFQLTATPASTWTGATSSSWNEAANWSPNGVPSAFTDVIIPAGLTNYPTLSVAGTCNNLTIKSADASTGSLIGQSNLTVSGTTSIERFVTGNKWHFVSSPVEGQDSLAFIVSNNIAYSSSIARYGITHYDESTNQWGAFYDGVGTDAPFGTGLGYLMRTDADDSLYFSGSLASGTIPVTLAKTDVNGWNGLGNPYPSALHANSTADVTNNLLTENSAAIDPSYLALYLWDEQVDYNSNVGRNDYKIINHSGGSVPGNNPNLGQDYIQVGQGFFVKAASNASTFNFTEAMQTHQDDVAFKSAQTEDWAVMQLNIAKDNVTTGTLIKFNENMSKGLDVGYDAGAFKTGFSIYTRLVEDNGVDFCLQCLPAQNIQMLEIPVGINVRASGEITFSLQEANFPADIVPVLNDKQMQIKTAFTGEEVTYSTNIDDNSLGYGRFTISFTTTTGAEEILNNKPAFTVWYGTGSINVDGDITAGTNMVLYDLQGRKLLHRTLQHNRQNRISVSGLVSGVYLVQISNGNSKFTQKVVVTQ